MLKKERWDDSIMICEDNEIRDEGAVGLSEMLKVNSTLTSLDLKCGFDLRNERSSE